MNLAKLSALSKAPGHDFMPVEAIHVAFSHVSGRPERVTAGPLLLNRRDGFALFGTLAMLEG